MKRLSFIILLLSFDSTEASLSDVMGLGARNKAMGQANGVTSAGAFSAKTNPAALGKIKKNKFSGGYGFNNMNLATGNTSTDNLSDDNYENSSGISANNDLNTSSNLAGLEFGAAFSLGEKLSFGLVSILPAGTFLKVHAFTGDEITYLHFNEKQQRPEIYASFGYALSSSFSLGAGVYYSLSADGNMQMGLSDQDAEARFSLDVQPLFIPFTGAHLETTLGDGKLLAGVMYRAEQSADTKMVFDIRFGIPGLGTIPFNGESLLIPFYDPAQIALGLGHRGRNYEFYLGSEINYWSNYRPPMIILTGNINEITSNPVSQSPVVLQDTYSYRLGGELKDIFSSKPYPLSIRGGLEYHTSALPDDSHNVTVVDSDRWAMALGLGLNIPKVPDVIDKPFSLDATIKYTQLFQKKLTRTLSNGTTETIDIDGSILAFFMGVDFEF